MAQPQLQTCTSTASSLGASKAQICLQGPLPGGPMPACLTSSRAQNVSSSLQVTSLIPAPLSPAPASEAASAALFTRPSHPLYPCFLLLLVPRSSRLILQTLLRGAFFVLTFTGYAWSSLHLLVGLRAEFLIQLAGFGCALRSEHRCQSDLSEMPIWPGGLWLKRLQ